MTREEKINQIIEATVFSGDNWGSEREFLNFVANLLLEGFNGYENMSDEEIGDAYSVYVEQKGDE